MGQGHLCGDRLGVMALPSEKCPAGRQHFPRKGQGPGGLSQGWAMWGCPGREGLVHLDAWSREVAGWGSAVFTGASIIDTCEHIETTLKSLLKWAGGGGVNEQTNK